MCKSETCQGKNRYFVCSDCEDRSDVCKGCKALLPSGAVKTGTDLQSSARSESGLTSTLMAGAAESAPHPQVIPGEPRHVSFVWEAPSNINENKFSDDNFIKPLFSPSPRPHARPCFRRLSRVFAVRPVFSPSFPCFRRRSPSFAVFRRISTYFTIFHIYFGAWNCIALPKEQGPSHPLQPTHVHTHACTRSQGEVFNVLVQCANHLTQRNFQALSRLSLSRISGYSKCKKHGACPICKRALNRYVLAVSEPTPSTHSV